MPLLEQEEKTVKSKKVLTAKAKTAIIVSVCLAVVILAVALPVGLIFGKKVTVPEPYFLEFNDSTEYIRVKWNKIRSAVNYDYIFYYGDPKEAKTQDLTVNNTQNTTTSIRRHKGIVAFKVKANIVGENTSYSNWITVDVPALTLDSPTVTITDDLDISWTPVLFSVDQKTYEVKNYEYEIRIDDKVVLPDGKISATKLIAKDYLKKLLSDSDKVAENVFGEWENILITVKVKAVTYVTFGDAVLSNISGADEYLSQIYDDGDFGIGTLSVTKEIYMNL